MKKLAIITIMVYVSLQFGVHYALAIALMYRAQTKGIDNYIAFGSFIYRKVAKREV